MAQPERRRAVLLRRAPARCSPTCRGSRRFFFQSDDNASNRIDSFAPLSVESFCATGSSRWTATRSSPLRDLPGRARSARVLRVGRPSALAVALVRLRSAGDRPRDGVALVAAAALATPAGLLLYSLVAKSIVLPRNMSASLPAAALLVGWALTAVGRRAAPRGRAWRMAASAWARSRCSTATTSARPSRTPRGSSMRAPAG